MQHHQNHDRLSRTDSIFLYLEREGVPLHIAGVSMLEGIVSFDECVRFVESKIPLIPRYRQRVVAPVFNIGRPVWEFDPAFDVRHHIHEATLKHGTEQELKVLAGKILSKVMDRQRPLWDFTLVRGLKGDRTGLVMRVHHCLADGVSGVDLMNVMMGPTPTAAPARRKKRKFPVPPRRDPVEAVVDDLMNSVSSIFELALETQVDLLKFAERIASGGEGPAANGSRNLFLMEMATATQPLHFNQTVQGPQKVAWAEIPLASIKAVKEVCGCSINDVVLTLVTAAMRRYASLHGDDLSQRLLRIMVPVNVRDQNRKGELGNQISLIPVTVPLNIQNPRKLLEAVHERTEFLKKSYVAELVTLAGALIGMLPTAVQAVAGPLATYLPITPFNLVCTNVPGPQYPLYFMRHKMLSWYPYVPIGGDMAVNVAVLSYNGTVYFGFSGDVHAAPDMARLEKYVAASMRELQLAAKTRAYRKRRPVKLAAMAAVSAGPAQTDLKPASGTVLSVPAPSPGPKPAEEEKKVAGAVA